MPLKTSKAAFALAACLGLTVPLMGCKSLEFKKPTLPSLAFFKKNSDDELPPPARHFDPARFESEGGSDTRVAATNVSSSNTKLNSQIDEFAAATEKKMENAQASLQGAAGSGSKPRQRYRMDDFETSTDDTSTPSSNSFALDTNKIKESATTSVTAFEDGLTDAQKQFRSAMNSAVGDGDRLKNRLAGAADNSFDASPIAPASGNSFSGFGSTPLKSAANSLAQNTANANAAVSNALNSADDRLRSAATDIQQQARSLVQSPANSQLKSEFEKRVTAVREIGESGQAKLNNQLQTLADVSTQTRDTIAKPFNQFAPSNGTTKPNSLLGLSKPNQLNANENLGNGNLGTPTIDAMRSEVAEARRQIALLKQQVADSQANQLVGQTKQALVAGTNQFRDQVQNATNRVGNSIQNITQPLRPRTATNPSPLYPSTPHGGFSKNSQAPASGSNTNQFAGLVPAPNQSTIGAVSFNSIASATPASQPLVAPAVAKIPAGSGSRPVHQATPIETRIPDVRIPDSILTGSSSFTPGSTIPLRR